MQTADHAIHALRNNLAAILIYAEMAREGDTEAQALLADELKLRLPEIHEELDALGDLEVKLRGK